MILLVANL